MDWFITVAMKAGLVVDRSPSSLTGLLTFVVAHAAEERHISPSPLWFREVHERAGWTRYGTALMEGLMAYVTQIYRHHAGEDATWVLNEDPRHAYFHQPVMRNPVLPPSWVQIRTVVVRAQRGDGVDRLRTGVENTLAHYAEHTVQSGQQVVEEPWVVVTPLDRHRWQVSLPEDVDERLGFNAYASLEDRFAAVDGVTEAIMEDRDRALLQTRSGVAQADLEQRLEALLASLAPTDLPQDEA